MDIVLFLYVIWYKGDTTLTYWLAAVRSDLTIFLYLYTNVSNMGCNIDQLDVISAVRQCGPVMYKSAGAAVQATVVQALFYWMERWLMSQCTSGRILHAASSTVTVSLENHPQRPW